MKPIKFPLRVLKIDPGMQEATHSFLLDDESIIVCSSKAENQRWLKWLAHVVNQYVTHIRKSQDLTMGWCDVCQMDALDEQGKCYICGGKT